jgi:hypothetical protein
MFRALWVIGWQPVCGCTAQITVITVETLESKPKRWRLFFVFRKTQFYIRVRHDFKD